MSDPVILLVESNSQSAQRISLAVEQRLMPRPHHVPSGEDAVIWATVNSCDVCILSDVLPGIDGMETYLRLKQRRPSLQVVMVASTASEDAAVAAFRAGVSDYVARKPGFEQAVAEIVRKIARPSTSVVAPSASSDQLLAPTYQNKLRAIGRQMDLYRYQSIHLMEVAGGMLVRVASTESRMPEALEFMNEDFPQLLRAGVAARGEGERPRGSNKLLPTGYEDFMRALGYRIDLHLADAVSITELQDFIAVGCIGKIELSGNTAIGPIQWLLYAPEIELMLNEAYRRRAPEQERKKSTGIGRMLGRRND